MLAAITRHMHFVVEGLDSTGVEAQDIGAKAGQSTMTIVPRLRVISPGEPRELFKPSIGCEWPDGAVLIGVIGWTTGPQHAHAKVIPSASTSAVSSVSASAFLSGDASHQSWALQALEIVCG